jgi:hypothetical protein
MSRFRARPEGGTYIQPKGKEFYRGHLIEKCLVSLADVPFWRVDVKPIGLAKAASQIFLQERTDKVSLPKLVSEAKGLIGHIINRGTGLPAVQVKESYMAGKPFDALVMKSSTGKRSVCPRHWAEVEFGARHGSVNAIVFGILLMQRFTSKLYADGMLREKNALANTFTINMLLDSYAPLCCWIGDADFATILADANPTTLLARAREQGLL